MKSLAILFGLFFLLNACETQAPEYSAQQLSVQELNTSAGYAWFPTEMALFTPNQLMVDSVRNAFDPKTEKVAIFVKPSCSCRGTTRLFPQIMKTLLSAGVDMSKVEVWSMRSTTDKQPYALMIAISDLPAVFVIKNNVVTAEIHDVNYTNTNADTLIATALAR